MSAKITVIFYIAVCFEVGIVLLIVPWSDFWVYNFFLEYLVSYLNWQHLNPFLQSGYVKGAISALGIINMLICFGEIKNFRHLVATLSQPEKKDDEGAEN